jgi:hypothetical protein
MLVKKITDQYSAKYFKGQYIGMTTFKGERPKVKIPAISKYFKKVTSASKLSYVLGYNNDLFVTFVNSKILFLSIIKNFLFNL